MLQNISARIRYFSKALLFSLCAACAVAVILQSLAYVRAQIVLMLVGTTMLTGLGSRAAVSKRRGFSLIEILVVIGIIMILAGILFSVFGKAKQSSLKISDVERMKQVYLAFTLYEDDNNGESPASLLFTRPYSKSDEIYRSLHDGRKPVGGSYPADLYVFDSPLRSSFPISFAYLRSFVDREFWHPALSYPTMRADPNWGILANKWYKDILDPAPVNPNPEHGPITSLGPLYRIRMDGSLKVVPDEHDGFGVGCSINGCFKNE